MAITVKHSKVSTIPDEADTSLVRPSDWNADHVLTGTVPIVNGGTGQTTANLAFNALAPSQTGNTGKYLTTDGTDTSWSTNPLGTVTSITAGTGLTGGTITTSGTIAIDSTVVTLTGTQTLTNKTLTTPIIGQINDVNSNEILLLTPVTSATDYFTLKNGIGVGVPLHIVAEGSSTNIGLHIQPKGSGLVTISDGTDFNKGIRFRSSSSAASAITLLDAVSSAGRVVTLPDATTTLVGRETTDTLTNKSISGSTNTLTNIANASLTNSAITINGTSTSLGGSINVGTVTSVTGTSPVVSSGGATPAISMPAATTSINGYLTSTDWTTFNGKQANLVSGTNIRTVSGTSLLGSGDIGTIGIAYGGTGLTSTPANGALDIGNGTGFTRTTLTAGTGISVTNASGSITVASTVGAIAWQSVQTANFNAASNSGYPVNTTSSAITVTLPASPSAGNIITIIDYAGTATTNNITISANGNKIQGLTANAIISTNRQALNFVYVDSTQGWLSYAQEYAAVFQSYIASYLIVAGGGGGGGGIGGGGGAGGLLSNTTTFIPGTIYSVVVGAGGGGGNNVTKGTSGSNSSLTGITSAVGGGGGANGQSGANVTGLNGGSGGGGYNGGAGGSGTSGQGYAGGTSSVSYLTGGGGGAGAVGSDGSVITSGNGGTGVASSITGSSVTYAGGGGGGAYGPQPSFAGSGGSGGGGGGTSTDTTGTAGTINTGGGAGGGGYSVSGSTGGAGGSGVVIISVPTINYTGTTTGSPTVTTSGSNTIMKFTASGSYTA